MQLLPREIKDADIPDVVELASDDCAGALLDVAPPVVRTIRKMMREHRLSDLSVPQFRTLGLLIYSPEASLSLVADYIGSSLPAASRMVDGLVARNLVGRKECCRNRRQVSLELTPLGRSAFLESRQATQHQLAQRLAGLSTTQRQTVMEAMRWLGEVFGSDAEQARAPLAIYPAIIPDRVVLCGSFVWHCVGPIPSSLRRCSSSSWASPPSSGCPPTSFRKSTSP